VEVEVVEAYRQEEDRQHRQEEVEEVASHQRTYQESLVLVALHYLQALHHQLEVEFVAFA
jgi:hypothetical protein